MGNQKSFLKLIAFVSVLFVCKADAQITNNAKLKNITPSVPYIPRVTGYVDMHTHLMAHLGFGGKMMYGTPDLTTIGLAGSFYSGFDAFKAECNTVNEPAGTIERALGNCNAVHGGHGVDNDCGNYVRADIVNQLDRYYVHRAKNGLHTDHPHAGYPNFTHWPHQSGVTHQQMWYEWVKRAFQGGLKIMVTLAVNNSLLAEAGSADQYIDDKSSVELQLREMKKFVANHSDFMEIAKTSADALRIIKANKMAVVLGVETDDIGNFTRRSKHKGEIIRIGDVKAELQNLYNNYDVRYIFPVHFADNVFGGTAVNSSLFALSTKYYSNSFVSVRNSCGENISYKHTKQDFDFIASNLLKMQNLGWVIDNQPNYPAPPAGCGHANAKGLSALGISSLVEMMNLGMMIDVDHMSQLSMQRALDVARLYRGGYPVNAGHTGIRPATGGNERNLYRPFVDSIIRLGGMLGVGMADATPDNFIAYYNDLSQESGRSLNIAFGTDVNGMEPLLKCTPGLNSATFYSNFPLQKCMRPDGTAWDYTKEGVAHYGLLPEFMKDVKERPNGAAVINSLNSSADRFIMMWEKCERLSNGSR